MLGVTVLAVTKVIVAVCIGAFTSRKIPNASVTVRDFSFIIANVLLPCLTFYNTAVSVNAELLIHCSVLLVFALLLIGLGLLCGLLASKVLFRVRRTGIPHELRKSLRFTLLYSDASGMESSSSSSSRTRQWRKCGVVLQPVVCVVVSGALEQQRVEASEVLPLIEPPGVEYEEQPFYHYASMLACSLQNAVTLPLSLLQALAVSLPWIDLPTGTSYIFIYSVIVSAYFWSAGPMIVAHAKSETDKRRTIREVLEVHQKLQSRRDAATQTEVHRAVSLVTSPNVQTVRMLPLPSQAAPSLTRAETTGTTTSGEAAHLNGTPATLNIGDADVDAAAAALALRSTGKQTDFQPNLDYTVFAATSASCETFPYNWRERGLVRVMYERDFKDAAAAEKQDTNRLLDFLRGCKNVIVHLLQTLAFTSVVAGVVVGLVPPLRWLLLEGPLSMLMDSIALIAQGSVPASLLLLGSNLVGTSSLHDTVPEVHLREAEQNTELPLNDEGVDPSEVAAYNAQHAEIEFDEHASFTLANLQRDYAEMVAAAFSRGPTATSAEAMREGGAEAVRKVPSSTNEGVMNYLHSIFSLHGIRKSFVFGILFIRLLFLPAVGFTLVLTLRSVMPVLFGGDQKQNVLVLVLLGELAAPTAINCTLLFNTQHYMPGVWAKMLFFQYIACTLSFVLWCTISLYISS
ncbi:putative transporter [Trypanosoma grayi]|uniref:putative transporter n=1 Tax=Trypanosoma grayi TaxID=71804 RepID=UPI0004F4BA64|nr:putative transporter [Trypanosoma grayi]KEG12703.1 putative transporter [Trypanosoma grayi]